MNLATASWQTAQGHLRKTEGAHGAHSPGEAGSRGRSMSVGGNRTEQEANNTSCQVSQQEQEANSTSRQVPQPTCSSWKWTSRLMPVMEPD